MKKYLITPILTVSLGLSAFATQVVVAQTTPAAPAPGVTKPDIVAVAANRAELKTLVTAIKAAELVAALQEKGPFTVFAPTDTAFAKLPPGELANLLKPENKGKLADILKAHVVKGKVLAADVKSGDVVTLGGEKVNIEVKNGKVTFGKAAVIATDFMGGNGVIHEIDTVIIPD
jgi:uncharacterized surface protein with fasciclin (FAS1) repeats